MIKSMTSFGRAQSEDNSNYGLSVEMKSVNNRYLDINIRLPKNLFSLEEEVRKIISKKINRGKVDVFINMDKYSNNTGKPKVNMELAHSYFDCLTELKNEFLLNEDISLSLLTKFPDVISVEEDDDDLEEILKELKNLLNKSLDNMIEMRETEGNKLKEDILLKLNDIEGNVNKLEDMADNVPIQYKNKLMERLEELLSTSSSINEDRVAMEVAIFADKAAVDEEITRMYSHINQMRKTLEISNEPIGRKLDFIIQEMNRETNTIGSKANDTEMTNLVINNKNLLEKIREQIQNIE